MSDDTNDSKVIAINQGKSSKTRKNSNEKSASASKKKPPFGIIAKYLSDFIDGGPLALGAEFAPFTHKFTTYRVDPSEPKIILEQDQVKKTVWLVSDEYVMETLLKRTSNFIDCPAELFNLGPRKMLEVVQMWKALSNPLTALPSSVGFKSDTDYAFTRLDFDPIPIEDEWELEKKAPIFSEILNRITNAGSFCARLGSLYDKNADRKQILWMYGPGDAGKSQLSWMIQELVGNSVALLSPSILRSQFWKAILVGKKVAIDSDAKANFLQSDEFKTFTGDGKHSVNQKNKPIVTANVDCQGFFFSNDPAVVENTDSNKNRLLVCYIGSVPLDRRLPEHIFREKMRQEFPYIVGYCQHVYELVGRGYRIPIDDTLLQEAIDSSESSELAVFERNFEVDPDGSVSNNVFDDILRREGLFRSEEKRKFKTFIKNRHQISEGVSTRNGRSVRLIRGISVRLNTPPASPLNRF